MRAWDTPAPRQHPGTQPLVATQPFAPNPQNAHTGGSKGMQEDVRKELQLSLPACLPAQPACPPCQQPAQPPTFWYRPSCLLAERGGMQLVPSHSRWGAVGDRSEKKGCPALMDELHDQGCGPVEGWGRGGLPDMRGPWRSSSSAPAARWPTRALGSPLLPSRRARSTRRQRSAKRSVQGAPSRGRPGCSRAAQGGHGGGEPGRGWSIGALSMGHGASEQHRGSAQ
jgi:hypothetical protein